MKSLSLSLNCFYLGSSLHHLDVFVFKFLISLKYSFETKDLNVSCFGINIFNTFSPNTCVVFCFLNVHALPLNSEVLVLCKISSQSLSTNTSTLNVYTGRQTSPKLQLVCDVFNRVVALSTSQKWFWAYNLLLKRLVGFVVPAYLSSIL